MLATDVAGDKFKMLVTVLAISVTKIHYLFTLESGTNIQKMTPIFTNRRELFVTDATMSAISLLPNH